MYMGSVCASSVYYAFENPLSIVSDTADAGAYLNSTRQDEHTPLHEMSLALAGIIFSMVIGPFFIYHLFLVT